MAAATKKPQPNEQQPPIKKSGAVEVSLLRNVSQIEAWAVAEDRHGRQPAHRSFLLARCFDALRTLRMWLAKVGASASTHIVSTCVEASLARIRCTPTDRPAHNPSKDKRKC